MNRLFTRLRARLRDRVRLAEARTAIRRADRKLARAEARRQPQYFVAPGVIVGGPRPARRGLLAFLAACAIAAAAATFYALRGGLFA